MLETACHWTLTLAGAVQKRLMIVQFHRVLSEPDPLLATEPDVHRFEQQLAWLATNFRIFTVGQALELLYSGRLPGLALCVTFDDGYRDNVQNALPILERHGVAATFFATTRFRESGMMWNDRVIEALRHWPQEHIDLETHGLGTLVLPSNREELLDPLLMRIKYLPYREREALADELFARSGAPARRMMMNDVEIRQLHEADMEIGGHTDGHPILSCLDDPTAQREVESNKRILEDIVDRRLTTFAYPNGRPHRDFDQRHIAIVRGAGYRYALTTSAGTTARHNDPYQVPRFTPSDRSPGRYAARLVLNYYRDPELVGA